MYQVVRSIYPHIRQYGAVSSGNGRNFDRDHALLGDISLATAREEEVSREKEGIRRGCSKNLDAKPFLDPDPTSPSLNDLDLGRGDS
ncbi:hypothetical protein BHM03_00025938 [Ensete ventricosum]|nr:hypothetical protein BHM03_00025938 [Ensete ventricosum]